MIEVFIILILFGLMAWFLIALWMAMWKPKDDATPVRRWKHW